MVHVADDKKSTREPKPGESLFKLRTELGLKIKENREKMIAQRLQEEKEKLLAYKQMESEDEDEDEDEDKEIHEEESNDGKNCEEELTHPLEISTEELNEEINDENIESESNEGSDYDNDSDVSDVDFKAKDTTQPRKRILTTLDDDSDNEISKEPPQNGKICNLYLC